MHNDPNFEDEETSYKCLFCGNEVTSDELEKTKDSRGYKCTECSKRILFKKVPEYRKPPVKAR